MPLYQYVKSVSSPHRRNKSSVVPSMVLMGLGGAILLWALWPILSFAVISDAVFSRVVSPVSDVQVKKNPSLLSPVAFAASTVTQPQDSLASFVNPNAWYPAQPQKRVVTPVNTYTLSIPKLKIDNAMVVIAGDDLGKSLVHYGGTGLPGQYGTAVVFGHSTLPQFYSPTNYKTIFSLLPTLKIGDEIDITYDDMRYRYVIYEMIVLDPSDLSVLEQRFDDSYLTLITCVPPGTYWKRLNVKAKLSNPQ